MNLHNFVAAPLRRGRVTSSNGTTLSYPATPLAEPALIEGALAGDRWVIDVSQNGNGIVPAGIQLFPFGTGTAADAFTLMLVGWRRVWPLLSDNRQQWIPAPITTMDCTLGTYTGVAGGQVIDTDKFAATISVTYEGTYNADVTDFGTTLTYSPGSNLVAWVTVPVVGFERLEIIKTNKTNTPTGNWLYTLLNRR